MMKVVLVPLALFFLAFLVDAETLVEDEELQTMNKDSFKGAVLGDNDDDSFEEIRGGGVLAGGKGENGDDDDNGSGTTPHSQYCVMRYRQCIMTAWGWIPQQMCRIGYYQCVRLMSNPCYRQRLTCLRNVGWNYFVGWNYYQRYLCQVRYRQCRRSENKAVAII